MGGDLALFQMSQRPCFCKLEENVFYTLRLAIPSIVNKSLSARSDLLAVKVIYLELVFDPVISMKRINLMGRRRCARSRCKGENI